MGRNKTRETVDPFASVSVSEVFFQLVKGNDTPKSISEALGMTPPTVVECLWKLREMGVVELGEKEGKLQHYRINWRRFAEQFLEHAFVPSKVPELKRLGREEGFRELLRRYYVELVGQVERGAYPRRTIWGAIYNFEEALPGVSLLPEIGSGEMGRLLRRWAEESLERMEGGVKGILERAIKGRTGTV